MTASKPPDEGTPRTDVVCRSIESDGMLLNRGIVTLQLAHDFAVESQRRMTMHARQLERELQAERQRCEGLEKELGAMRGLAYQERVLKEYAESRAASAEKDARRYRWLRENDGDGQVIVNWNIGHDWVSVENLDAAIDAASGEAG